MIRTAEQVVKPEWLDYNGHMNVAYYTLAFDLIFDDILIHYLGLDHEFIESRRMGPFALQSHFHYVSELLESQRFYGLFRILDYDHKRMHIYAEMQRCDDDQLCATWEGMSINVDHNLRKPIPYPETTLDNIRQLYERTKNQPVPDNIGQPLGIRRES